MDYIEINKFTQNKKVHMSLDHMHEYRKLNKEDSLRLIINACKVQYGVMNTAKILHGVGVNKIDLSV